MHTPILRLLDNVASLISQSYMLARARLASYPSPIIRLTSQRDGADANSQLLLRELAVVRSSRAGMKPPQRPDYAPGQRIEILQLIRLCNWSPLEAADHFALHPNTIRGWLRALRQGKTPRLFSGAAPAWNRIHDAVRWAAQQLRAHFPEPEFGTRTLACHLVRAGVQVGRSSVQGMLREEIAPPAATPGITKAAAKKEPLIPPAGKESDHLLKPQTTNRVWHVDLTTLHVLWLRFTIVAVIDGFSRRLLAVKVYAKVPGTPNVMALLRGAVKQFGSPRFLITDHGGQFQKRFTAGLHSLSIKHVRGRVRCPAMNGKVERFFRTFRRWLSATIVPMAAAAIQRKIDLHRSWYNEARPHSALGGRTPDEAWNGVTLPQPITFYARDAIDPVIHVSRRSFGGDRHLPVVFIALAARRRAA